MPFPYNENPFPPPEVPHIGECPICGCYLYGYEKIYLQNGKIVGCQDCICIERAEEEF